ncbi:PREDICTED: uncharacterized protein LOC109115211 [Nelumbo nucifera]|uniref:Uncharacterized protein LOC109115211 n=2 Tax=Nelumbo nucifera TaxID=4432 RepID=A0A1U8Q6U3_NELNU|nr:PREDICTED: uncharacterized protein LOC109115211 [Nelumbo nucifera]DAD48831.1 TPA_asm: hypothetical protein HUJ06_018767 [Nelumbo nucifera]
MSAVSKNDGPLKLKSALGLDRPNTVLNGPEPIVPSLKSARGDLKRHVIEGTSQVDGKQGLPSSTSSSSSRSNDPVQVNSLLQWLPSKKLVQLSPDHCNPRCVKCSEIDNLELEILTDDEECSDSDVEETLSLGSIDLQNLKDIFEEESLNTELLFPEEVLDQCGLGIKEQVFKVNPNSGEENFSPLELVLHKVKMNLEALAKVRQNSPHLIKEPTPLNRPMQVIRPEECE